MNNFNGITHAEKALEALKKAGSGKAAAWITKQVKSEMNIDSGNLSLYRTTEDISASLTALIDGKRGFVAGNNLQDAALTETAAQAAALAQASEPDEGNDISPEQPFAELIIGDTEPDNEKMYRRLQEFLDYTKTAYPTLQLNQCVLDFTRSDTVYANSNAVRFRKESSVYSFSAMFFAKDAYGTGSFNYSGAMHLDLNTPLKDWGGLDEVMRLSCGETRTQPLTGSFTGDIIITPANTQTFTQMLTGLFMSNMPLITGTSIWKDKLNTQVCSPVFTLHSRPCAPYTEIPSLVTGDGFKAENTTLIEKGVLKDFILSLYGSKKTGRPRCVSGGSGLTVEQGTVSKDSLIKNVKRGILLGRFSGGEPAANGDFSGVAKNSYLIENGCIVQPLSETMIAGNLVALLNAVQGISHDVINYGVSQAPWIHAAGVTISGK
ncbi:MAG: metallopeptidase TldD-related protein [Treponema sp.]